jgi:hypothetical protein
MKKWLQIMGISVLLLGLVMGCSCPSPAAPAKFMLSGLDIDPTTAAVNSTVTIEATVTNEGDESGSCAVNLTIGNHTDSKPVTLEGSNASTLVSFSYDAVTEGTYTVSVATPDDTKTGTLTVTSGNITPPPVIPTAGVGTKWIYYTTYENPAGTPKYDPVFYDIELEELGVMLAQHNEDTDEDITTETYRAYIDICPDAQRDITDPLPTTATLKDVDIWVSSDTASFLRQVARTHVEKPVATDAVATIDYFYVGAHGWPFTVGSTWDFTVQQVTESILTFPATFSQRRAEVVGVEDVTLTLYNLSQLDLNTGTITGTGTETTLSCIYIKHFEGTKLVFEEWLNLSVKTDVKMIDYSQFVGKETRTLVYYELVD